MQCQPVMTEQYAVRVHRILNMRVALYPRRAPECLHVRHFLLTPDPPIRSRRPNDGHWMTLESLCQAEAVSSDGFIGEGGYRVGALIGRQYSVLGRARCFCARQEAYEEQRIVRRVT